ncbi:serine/threonine-protein phosphatase 6 regulatory ankyrin repeat subunit B-like [Mizuhopecten yessoensis]|uniref:Serine/threonine-protein phosphatase 6 regulatory ankyrin repeat subunit C n=1 Tax=Mizuhopecten yessoensis TaxID=6573 RepID=A0A210QM97_MIZYE|nr:serine/threonine-protein phosphatase 6 regulatory ankyrin repeat subunit B-like [Mizuhopecten yessoensis]OWF49865.1 Serine/threonine-protein phosphatase 6 regulatory ankyrin repeat subunit C [Mizuhopecten yessoensis]
MGCKMSCHMTPKRESFQLDVMNPPEGGLPVGERLHNAILSNDLETCRQILKKFSGGKFPFLQEFPCGHLSRSPPLHVACMYRRPEIVKLFVENGADVSALDIYGRTPCNICLQYWPRIWPEEKTLFFDDLEIEAEFWNSIKEQIFKASCILEILLKHGADEAERLCSDNQSLLHFAAKKELHGAMKILIETGVDLNIRDVYLCTPLALAAKHGRLRSITYLTNEGADVTLVDVNGCTFLHHICSCERLTLFELRDATNVAHHPVINQTNREGQTILHITATQGNGDKISFLLQRGCDADMKDNMGRTPLFCLLDSCEPGCCLLGIECLLMEMTQINIRDKHGHYPICFSRYRKDIPGILKDLLAMSASPSPLFYLCVQKVRHTMGRDRQDVRHLSQLQLPGVLTAEIVLVSNFMNMSLLHKK